MQGLFPKLDATHVLIALKTCLAIVISLAIAFRLDWKPSFGAILIVVLQTPFVGSSYKKGLLYIAGTLSGSIAGLTMVALFAHSRVAFIVAMALLTGCGIYRLQVGRYPYAWLIFTVTAMLVGFFSVQDPSTAFDTAVMRSSTICVAVVITFLVGGILWPIRAGKVFERQLHGFLEGCRELISLTSRELAGDEPDPDAARSLATTQTEAFAALGGTLDAATEEAGRFKRFHAGYQQLLDQLHDLLLVIIALRDAMQNSRDGQAHKSLRTLPDNIRASLNAVEGDMAALLRDLGHPRDGTAGPRQSDARAGASSGISATIDTAFDAMLALSVRDVARQVTKLRTTFAGVEDPAQVPSPLRSPPSAPFSLTSVKFQKAASGGLVILLLGGFFIQTQWPMGLTLAMVFATVAIGIGAMVPLIMIGRQLLRSLIIGGAIAAPLYLGIMPRISEYEQLIPWLCVALLPLLYLMSSANPQTQIQSLFSAIFVIALLSLDETSQSYSFSSFVNMWIGLCGGFGGALAIFGLFSSVVPERELCKQVRSVFADIGTSIQGLAENPPGTPAGAAIVRTLQDRWQGHFKQLQTWSSAIDYQRVPGNTRQKTQALIESIERLALRFAASEYARRQPVDAPAEPLRESFGRVDDACVESFRLIANSLSDLKPIPALPDAGRLIQEIESRGEDIRQSAVGDDEDRESVLRFMSATVHLGSLADTIDDCRDKANALDWEAWNRNYF